MHFFLFSSFYFNFLGNESNFSIRMIKSEPDVTLAAVSRKWTIYQTDAE